MAEDKNKPTINPNLLLQKPDQIPNWKEVLGKNSGLTRQYIVSRNPRDVEFMVSQAVYKTLTNKDLFERGEELSTSDLPTEKLELKLLNMFEKERATRENNAFSKEVLESIGQGRSAAKEDLSKNVFWSIHYDYWQGTSYIGQSIYLSESDEKNNNLILLAPVQEIGEDTGFPTTIAEDDFSVSLNDSGREDKWIIDAKNGYETILNRLQEMGHNKNDADIKIKNSSMSRHFFDVLGYKRVNEILEKNGRPIADGHSNFFDNDLEHLRFVYTQLNPEEQEKVKKNRAGEIHSVLIKNIDTDGQKTELHSSVMSTGPMVSFDPESGNMNADITKSRWMNLSIEARPIVTENTRHDTLLNQRNQLIKDYNLK